MRKQLLAALTASNSDWLELEAQAIQYVMAIGLE